MSSKKVIRATVSYVELFNRCPTDQAANLRIMQLKNKQYLQRLLELPEELPKINWEHYKVSVKPEAVPIVEEFEKKYNEFKIPFPKDPYTHQIEELKKEVQVRSFEYNSKSTLPTMHSLQQKEVDEYIENSNQRITEYLDEIKRIQETIPLTEMTMEEWIDYDPENAPDFINKPTFWPHTDEEQLWNWKPVPSHQGEEEGEEKKKDEDDHEDDDEKEKVKEKDKAKKEDKKDKKEEKAAEKEEKKAKKEETKDKQEAKKDKKEEKAAEKEEKKAKKEDTKDKQEAKKAKEKDKNDKETGKNDKGKSAEKPSKDKGKK